MTSTERLAQKSAEAVLQSRINELQTQLRRLRESGESFPQNGDTSNSAITENLPPPGKRGYLFKWQDRSVGWGGTKWEVCVLWPLKNRIENSEGLV
jgi:hypothetical protein